MGQGEPKKKKKFLGATIHPSIIYGSKSHLVTHQRLVVSIDRSLMDDAKDQSP